MDIHTTEMSLFSGYGGFSLGLRLAYPDADFRTVAYIEWDKYCQQVIQARIGDGLLDDAPIWDDIKSFDGRPWRGVVDIITAGFPCQPYSNAGLQKRENDPRNLWGDTLRIIREVGPRLVVLENVPGLATAPRLNIKVLEVKRQLSLFDQNDNKPNSGAIHRRDLTAYGYPYMGRIVGDLSDLDYDAEWNIISAADATAPHLRRRWWLLAYPNRERPDSQNDCDLSSVSGMGLGYRRGEVAYPNADLGGRLHREHGIESAIG